MTIGIFVVRFPARSETFILTKVLGLLARGIDVRIFALNPSSDWDLYDELRGNEEVRHRMRIAPPTKPHIKALVLGAYRILAKMLMHPQDFLRFVVHNWKYRKMNGLGFVAGTLLRIEFVGERLDLLHVEFDMQAGGVADMKYYLGCPLLLSSRGALNRTSVPYKDPDFVEKICGQADAYHFISRYLDGLMTRLGLPAGIPRFLIPPAIDLNHFQESLTDGRTNSDVMRVVTVARLDWTKGFEFAIDAVALAWRSGVPIEYVIAGDGPYREAIEFAARQWGLLESGVVKFVGSVRREQVPTLYHQADVLLHLALDEGFCNAVIEAQGMGLPVIASDAGGLPENVEDGVTGFIVPRRNARASAERLRYLWLNPDVRQRMGGAGRERATRIFDLENYVGEFVRMYHNVVCARKNKTNGMADGLEIVPPERIATLG